MVVVACGIGRATTQQQPERPRAARVGSLAIPQANGPEHGRARDYPESGVLGVVLWFVCK